MNITPTEINRPLFSVTPDIPLTISKNSVGINRNATVEADYVNNILYIKIVGSTVFLSKSEFSLSSAVSPFSYAVNPDYKETQLYSNTSSSFTNSTTDLINGMTSGYVISDILPFADGSSVNKSSILINGYDSINRVHFRLDLERNYNNNICLYKGNSSANDSETYWCKSVSGELKSISMKIQEIQQSGGSIVYGVETIITPRTGSPTIVDTNLIATESTTATSLYKVTMNSIEGHGFTYTSTKAYNGQDYNLSWGIYNPTSRIESIFTQTGCRTVRFYGSDFLLLTTPNPAFVNIFNYKDWKVCTQGIEQTGSTTTTTGNNDFGLGNLSPLTKLLLGIGIPLFVFAGCAILGFMGGLPQIGLILGSVFGIGALIAMVMVGWLDVWVIILMIMVTAAVSVVLYRVFLNGGGSD